MPAGRLLHIPNILLSDHWESCSTASARDLLLYGFPAVLLPDHNELSRFVSRLGVIAASDNEVPVAGHEGVSVVSLGA